MIYCNLHESKRVLFLFPFHPKATTPIATPKVKTNGMSP